MPELTNEWDSKVGFLEHISLRCDLHTEGQKKASWHYFVGSEGNKQRLLHSDQLYSTHLLLIPFWSGLCPSLTALSCSSGLLTKIFVRWRGSFPPDLDVRTEEAGSPNSPCYGWCCCLRTHLKEKLVSIFIIRPLSVELWQHDILVYRGFQWIPASKTQLR